MKAKNVLVVVTRWYGGIHLGPDRFRHICNIARQALVDNGFSGVRILISTMIVCHRRRTSWRHSLSEHK
ncbi:unnamed protein product [Gongylonema pulchrum]|uniref:UPF0029 domain-containing protein n=1 Tax=Gongylonema pulchrum TaxID=637853 RepID=A0A183E7A0_9BILA|nr:unnamed protein product [Gongylonema pulchrum]